MEKLPINPVLVWIKNRIKNNKNEIIVINGPTGSGKTFAALSLCNQISEMLNTNFNLKDNMDFSFSQLLKETMLPQNQKPGTPFLFEEVGVVGSGSAARQWQSKANQFFFSFMQTTRHRQQILIMTCPHFSFLEKGTRSMVHLQMETAGIDFKRKIALLKPFRIQVNSRSGQFYFKYLRIRYKGKRYKLKILEVPYPPQDMVNEYEIIKTRYTTKLNKSIIAAEKEEAKPKSKSKVDDKKLKELMEQGLNNVQIAKILGVSRLTVIRHKKCIKISSQV